MIMHLFIGLITTSHCLSSPQSPDLNSTENVWFKGKYAVFNVENQTQILSAWLDVEEIRVIQDTG